MNLVDPQASHDHEIEGIFLRGCNSASVSVVVLAFGLLRPVYKAAHVNSQG